MNVVLPNACVVNDHSVATSATRNANELCMVKLVVIAAFAILGLANQAVADVTLGEALSQSKAGLTVPLSSYSIYSTKDGKTHKGVIVGGDPFTGTPTRAPIEIVVIPLRIDIITSDGRLVIFDPSIATPCRGGVAAVDLLKHSPLVMSQIYVGGGVQLGYVQYINAFMRAEFWKASPYAKSLDDHIHWTFAGPPSIVLPPFTPDVGIVDGDVDPVGGCQARGIVNQSLLVFEIKSLLIPILQSQGVISPTKLAFFLLKDVVTSTAAPPVGEQVGGAHSSIGNPVQTLAWAPYLTNDIDAANNKQDIHSISHEIAEWMMDPVGANGTPKWSAPGSTKCVGGLEVGDPLESSVITITSDRHPYHPQELAYFSWFFNADGDPSLGAGNLFSMGGTLKSPAPPCPPGGS